MELDGFSEEETADEPVEPVVRRSGRERQPSDHHREWTSIANGN